MLKTDYDCDPVNKHDAESDPQAQALLALLQLSSPALPVGAFAYSQGLEYALDSGWCKNAEDIYQWLQQGLMHGIGRLELPLYQRFYCAWQQQDYCALNNYNQQLLALRETHELYLEELQVGHAFARWHISLAPERKERVEQLTPPTMLGLHALSAQLSAIDLTKALIGFCWSWCENQIACASKALPLGQSDGQRILQRLYGDICTCVRAAQTIEDNDIGSGLFSLAMASALHEQQYSRLFRS